jgi:hypothetical protein
VKAFVIVLWVLGSLVASGEGRGGGLIFRPFIPIRGWPGWLTFNRRTTVRTLDLHSAAHAIVRSGSTSNARRAFALTCAVCLGPTSAIY